MKTLSILSLFSLLLISCKQEKMKDSHSYAGNSDARVQHADFDLQIDFENQIIVGKVAYQIAHNQEKFIFFDMRNLVIDSVWSEGKKIDFKIGKSDEVLGAALEIPIHTNSKIVTIFYKTTQASEALQWLSTKQTAGGKFPFLFTQGQAILSRTWFPCQDSPAIRFTYDAKVTVPKGMMALMSATNPKAIDTTGVYHFKMNKPIPAYLVALAAGGLEYASTGKRTGVYAEPTLIDASKYEFAEMEQMLLAAEQLYGPYLWERFDLLVLPPSFPFGGMENPMLTFATPTIIAGDRSLTALVAHELAHSWSGNLVTNATWNDFWLNEGFTVYIERRIMEVIYGKDYMDMLDVLGYQDLIQTLEDFGMDNEKTKLKLDLTGKDPDDGMNDIAYEKGYCFLRALEEKAGRANFDKFIKLYFETYKFKSITTEEFLTYLNKQLIEPYQIEMNINAWVYSVGLESDHIVPQSKRFDACKLIAEEFKDNNLVPDTQITSDWSTHEWIHFLRCIPENFNQETLMKLEKRYKLFETGNNEILFEWLQKCIASNYEVALPHVEMFLARVGRRKFVLPLFKSLIAAGYRSEAQMMFEKLKDNYHAVTSNSVNSLFK